MKHLVKVQIILYRNPKKPEFLLLKTNSKPPIWQGITGGVEEFDASLQDAAIRELKEELGIMTTEDTIIGPLHSFEFTTDRKGYEGTVAKEYCFAYEIQPEYEVKLSSEHSEYKWLPFNEAVELIDFDTPKLVMKKVMKLLKTM